MKEKVVLAYSGGLDTTAIIPWLKETYGYEVVCCCINCGQGEELDGLEERAKLSGASKLYIEDITDEFCDDYIVPCVQAGAVYEHKYLLGTAMARPGIAKKLVEIARKENAVAICHGATGKGNDQIRFELGIKALARAKDLDIHLLSSCRFPAVLLYHTANRLRRHNLRQNGQCFPQGGVCMNAFVDPELCIGCTQCAGLCPAVFRMEGVLAVAEPGPIPPEEVPQAVTAAQSCPVSAIRIEE